MRSPRWIAPIVTWLASTESAGRHRPGVRGVGPGAGHRRGLAPRPAHAARSRTPPQLGPVVADLLAKARRTPAWTAKKAAWPQPR